MSDTTNISWTDSTWNPWVGCRAVSPGCQNCYARTLVNGRMGGDFSKRRRTAPATFNAPLKWNKRPWVCDQTDDASSEREAVSVGMGFAAATFHRRRVFSLSLGDWLDPEVPIEWLSDMLDIIRRCPGLDFLLLTKRPELWVERMRAVANTGDREDGLTGSNPTTRLGNCVAYDWLNHQFPPGNVWIGTSIEDQKRADERIPELLKIPAKVRFLSAEPLLEPVRFRTPADFIAPNGTCGIHWVIVGGESGYGRRDCGDNAIESIAAQCRASSAACFVKQDCAARPGLQGRISADVWSLKQFPL